MATTKAASTRVVVDVASLWRQHAFCTHILLYMGQPHVGDEGQSIVKSTAIFKGSRFAELQPQVLSPCCPSFSIVSHLLQQTTTRHPHPQCSRVHLIGHGIVSSSQDLDGPEITNCCLEFDRPLESAQLVSQVPASNIF